MTIIKYKRISSTSFSVRPFLARCVLNLTKTHEFYAHALLAETAGCLIRKHIFIITATTDAGRCADETAVRF